VGKIHKIVFAVLIMMWCGAGMGMEKETPLPLFIKGGKLENMEAPDTAKHGNVKLSKYYFKSYLTNTASIITAPLHWEAEDLIKAGAIAGITIFLYTQDDKIKNYVQSHRSNIINDISTAGKQFGEYKIVFPAIGLLYGYGELFDNKNASDVALLSLESMILSGVFTQGFKFLLHRHRPFTNDPHNTFDGPSFQTDDSRLSFNSGHSALAFSIASVLSTYYYDKWYVTPIAVGLASLTAYSRVNDNQHWSSDAFFGAVIGYFTGKVVTESFLRKPRGGSGDKGINFEPYVTTSQNGIRISYNF
jgi:hypothetical protein